MSIVRNLLVSAGVGIAAIALSPMQASAEMIVNSLGLTQWIEASWSK